jgi:hypothetical protein
MPPKDVRQALIVPVSVEVSRRWPSQIVQGLLFTSDHDISCRDAIHKQERAVKRAVWFAVAAAASLALAGAASADVMKYSSTLRGRYETPPTSSKGWGAFNAEVDTSSGQLSYDLTLKDLAGVTSAELRGRDAANQQERIALPITGSADAIHGSVHLTPAQVQDLNNGRLLLNVDTRADPTGEIAGSVNRED